MKGEAMKKEDYDFSGKFVAVVGSNRFRAEHANAFGELAVRGAIVVPIGAGVADSAVRREVYRDNYLKKLGRCDAVFVVNPAVSVCSVCRLPCCETTNGSSCCRHSVVIEPYAGDDTRAEIAMAEARGLDVVYLNEPAPAADAPGRSDKTYTWDEVRRYVDAERACCVGAVESLHDWYAGGGIDSVALKEAAKLLGGRKGYVHPARPQCGLKDAVPGDTDGSGSRTRREPPDRLYAVRRSDGWWMRSSGDRSGEWYAWFNTEYCLFSESELAVEVARAFRARTGFSGSVEVIEFSVRPGEVFATFGSDRSPRREADDAKKVSAALTDDRH